jgi:hypothetical protein
MLAANLSFSEWLYVVQPFGIFFAICGLIALAVNVLVYFIDRGEKRTRQNRVLEEVRAFKATEQKLIDVRRSHDFWADMYESIFKGR